MTLTIEITCSVNGTPCNGPLIIQACCNRPACEAHETAHAKQCQHARNDDREDFWTEDYE